MKIICNNCGKNIVLKQKYPYHAGFSNRGFLYCDSCPTLVKFDVFNPNYVTVVGEKHPWSLASDEKKKVEETLKPCPCCKGGRFRFAARPRCPKCNAELPDLLKDDLHFIEIGKVLDGDSEDVWL